MPIRLKNFNSIKVRLEPMEISITTMETKFQFHKGTIRTLNPGETIKLGYKFQFHKGTIRTLVSVLYTTKPFGISIP